MRNLLAATFLTGALASPIVAQDLEYATPNSTEHQTYLQIVIEEGIPTSNNIVEDSVALLEDWLEDQGINATKTDRLQREDPRFARLKFVTRNAFNEMMRSRDPTVDADRYGGLANPSTRTGFIAVDDLATCDQYKLLSLFGVARHEYLHLLGLYHPNEVQGTNISLGEIRKTRGSIVNYVANAMIQGSTQDNLELVTDICAIPYTVITHSHLPSYLSALQINQAHESLESGAFWQNLVKERFSFKRHIENVERSKSHADSSQTRAGNSNK